MDTFDEKVLLTNVINGKRYHWKEANPVLARILTQQPHVLVERGNTEEKMLSMCKELDLLVRLTRETRLKLARKLLVEGCIYAHDDVPYVMKYYSEKPDYEELFKQIYDKYIYHVDLGTCSEHINDIFN